MADILIKNMEMPKNCLWCEIRDCSYGNDLYLERPNDCPIVEVKPHGVLKDFNDILTIFDKVIHDVDDKTNALLCDLLVQIQYAPTVLEASNGCD